MDSLLSISVGLSLAASCGLRVFLPLLILSIGTHTGWVRPGSDMAWVGSWPVLASLTLLALAEVVAYYIPWVDNLLDTLATPLATLAGAFAASATMLQHDPAHAHGLLPWAGSMLSGGAAAGAVQLTTVAARAGSSLLTLGSGNHVVATAENAGAATLSLMAILAPVAGGVLVLSAVYLAHRWFVRRPRTAPGAPSPSPARPQPRPTLRRRVGGYVLRRAFPFWFRTAKA